MPILRRKCRDCDREYDLLEYNGVVDSLAEDQPDPSNVGCPSCGSAAVDAMLGLARGIKLGGSAGATAAYPYFDRGLGVMIDSEQHRQREAKARGLIPTDGDHDFAQVARDDEATRLRDEGEYAKMMEEYQHGENRAEYAKARQVMKDLGPGYWDARKQARGGR